MHPYKEHMNEAIRQLIYVEECLPEGELRAKIDLLIEITTSLQLESIDNIEFNMEISRPNLTENEIHL